LAPSPDCSTINIHPITHGRLAQLVAQHDHTVKVGGSNPSSPTIFHLSCWTRKVTQVAQRSRQTGNTLAFSKIWITLAGCAITIVAVLAAKKLALATLFVDVVLNAAENCGGETTAGGVASGAGALGCDPGADENSRRGRTGSGTLADGSVSGVGGVAGGSGRSSYDDWQRYREQLKQKSDRGGGPSDGGENKSSTFPTDQNKATVPKSGSADPVKEGLFEQPKPGSGSGEAQV
jgi:hypothetical protein